ncbi:MAG: aldo/keto reductase [Nitrospiraceae bacterium]|nr:aldo/keto reductase [Nitrospiraceae bacterium]
MRYRKLGKTGLFVSEFCLGTMTFGGKDEFWGAIGKLEPSEVDRLVRKAVDSGINFFDTADVYSDGQAEVLLGGSLRRLGIPREEVVIATKVFGETASGPNSRGLSRHHIMNAVRESLSRLGLTHIDLYQVHGFDPATPVEETLRALDDLVRQGLVRYVGVSNWAAWQVMKARGISERESLSRFESLQAYYTVAGRDLEREILPMLEEEEMGLLVWSPLAGGLLSGKYGRGLAAPAGSRRSSFDFPPVDLARAYDVIDVMRKMAKELQVSVAQVALAWLLHQSSVTSVILGAKSEEQLAENLGASRVRLSPDDLVALDRSSALTPEYPGWMLVRQGEYRRKQLAGLE